MLQAKEPAQPVGAAPGSLTNPAGRGGGDVVDLTEPLPSSAALAAALATRAVPGPLPGCDDLIDLCGDDNAATAPRAAPTGCAEVIDLCSSSDEEEQRPQQQQQQRPAQQQQQRRVPSRGRGAVPRVTLPAAVLTSIKMEPGSEVAQCQKQPVVASKEPEPAAPVGPAAAQGDAAAGDSSGRSTAVTTPCEQMLLLVDVAEEEADAGGEEAEMEEAAAAEVTAQQQQQQQAAPAPSSQPAVLQEPCSTAACGENEVGMDWQPNPPAVPCDSSAAAPADHVAAPAAEGVMAAVPAGRLLGVQQPPANCQASSPTDASPSVAAWVRCSAGGNGTTLEPLQQSLPVEPPLLLQQPEQQQQEHQQEQQMQQQQQSQQTQQQEEPLAAMEVEDASGSAPAEEATAMPSVVEEQAAFALGVVPQQQQQQELAHSPSASARAGLSAGLRRILKSVQAVGAASLQQGLTAGTSPAASTAAAPVTSGPSGTAAAAAAAPDAASPSAAAAPGAAAPDAAGPSGAAAPESAAPPADAMPDQSDAGAMLRWLRARTPQHLLQAYSEPHTVTEAEAATTAERLRLYEAEMERVRNSGEATKKFDLVAAKNIEQRYREWGLWSEDPGHKAGVAVGQRFAGRGPLKAAGIHSTYFTGIQYAKRGGTPALAICMSGGYEDDDDHGDWFWYTGEGGRRDGVQISDQEWGRGNAALRVAQERGTAVRVCRAVAKAGDPKKLDYTYDGLYAVIVAERVPQQGGGPLICRFLLVGIPGHYQANKSVSWVELRGFRNNLQLARPTREWDEEEEEEEEGEEVGRYPKRPRSKASTSPASAAAAAAAAAAPKRLGVKKKRKAPAPTHPAFKLVRQDAAWAAAQAARPGFLCADISGGVEARKIPAFNEVDEEPWPTGLTYIRRSTAGSAAATELLAAGASVMPSSWCGKEKGRSAGVYNEDGCMTCTRSEGQWECCDSCTRASCKRNRAISDRGMFLPLEVFRTQSKGWGLRADVGTPAGAFICSYEGVLLSHEEAEQLRGADSYLFDLDHFIVMAQDTSLSMRARDALPPLPFEPTDDCPALVIDAANTGNVARFINHSCDPNLVLQPMLLQGDSGLRYTVGMFAARDIPRGQELCYDYNYKVGMAPGQELACQCGAPNCRGRLL